MLLAMADQRFGLAAKLSCVFSERRDPGRFVHSLGDMIRARIFAIACGYEDGNDLDRLSGDPAFQLACGRTLAVICVRSRRYRAMALNIFT